LELKQKRKNLLLRDNNLQLLAMPHIMKIKAYRPGKPVEEVKRELGLKTVIKLASNENPLGPSSKAIEAIKKYASEVNIYPDGGSYYLKKALAEKLRLEEERIILGNGSDEIVSLITRVFLQKGEEAIMGDPSFLMYKIDTQLSQARILSIPLSNFKLNLSAMAKAVTGKTKLIFISNPNNPTGTIVEEKEVKTFFKNLPSRIIVILDEAYFEYVEDKHYP
jgi:histidinol-phosphate aminotransferase